MEDQDSGGGKKQVKKGYGKRPMWQWVLIYVVVAVVVYGLIYLLFMRDSGTNGGSGLGY